MKTSWLSINNCNWFVSTTRQKGFQIAAHFKPKQVWINTLVSVSPNFVPNSKNMIIWKGQNCTTGSNKPLAIGPWRRELSCLYDMQKVGICFPVYSLTQLQGIIKTWKCICLCNIFIKLWNNSGWKGSWRLSGPTQHSKQGQTPKLHLSCSGIAQGNVDIPKDKDSTTSLGNPFQCLTTLSGRIL